MLGGAAYRFSDRLSIGPGLGIFSDIEDDADLFPILRVLIWHTGAGKDFRTSHPTWTTWSSSGGGWSGGGGGWSGGGGGFSGGGGSFGGGGASGGW